MEKMLCIAGFGDDSSMFDALTGPALSSSVDVVQFDLPGFGAPAFSRRPTTLNAVAEVVDAKARRIGAHIVLAHSVASIIASLAALRAGSPIQMILSLEGNLTAEDAYFSGTAANYDTPFAFRDAFLERLSNLADEKGDIVARYREVVSRADPKALWQLGRDAYEFSQKCVPGDLLARSADVTYLYNPENLPTPSLRWLDEHDMRRIQLEIASHWASVDCPDLLAEAIKTALSG